MLPCENKNSSPRNDKKRKDPKTMTIDELEDYISRNKNKFKTDNTDNKSLNSSFQSQRNLNYSLNESSQLLRTKINETNYKPNSSNSAVTNLQNNNLIKHNKLNPNYNYINNNIKNPFIDPYAQSPREHFAAISNTTETTATAASNYLRSLQDQIKQLTTENDELKSNFCQISEILENERSQFKNKLDNDFINNRGVENALRNETCDIENENRHLIKENEEMKAKLSFLGSTLALLEKEKDRHLEQNALDREQFENQIESLRKENEENKLKVLSLTGDNNILTEKLSRTNDDMSSIEKKCQMLKEENQKLKKGHREKTSEHQKELEQHKIKFEADQAEWIGSIKSLKEIIAQLEKEKNAMSKKYEKSLHELVVKITRLEGNNNNNKTSSSYLHVNNNGSNSCSQVKSKSKSQERVIPGKKKKPVKASQSLKVSQISVQSNNRGELYEKLMMSPRSVSSHKSISNSGRRKVKKVKKLKKSSELKLSNSNVHKSNAGRTASYDQQLSEINDGIFGLERNIADLNRNYKSLITKLNTSNGEEEATLLKRNINIVGSSLEDQSEKLQNLKVQQQEILKKSLAYS